MNRLTLESIRNKIKIIERIQQRRIDIDDTNSSIGDALCLNVREAKFLLRQIYKLRTILNRGRVG